MRDLSSLHRHLLHTRATSGPVSDRLVVISASRSGRTRSVQSRWVFAVFLRRGARSLRALFASCFPHRCVHSSFPTTVFCQQLFHPAIVCFRADCVVGTPLNQLVLLTSLLFLCPRVPPVFGIYSCLVLCDLLMAIILLELGHDFL